MPYQKANQKNDNHLSSKANDQPAETDEQAVENTVQGADLLLSLTKGPCTNLVVTPQDTGGNNTSPDSLENISSTCDSGMGPPITSTGIRQRNNHHPRMLYHSPIKISSSSSTSTTKKERRNLSSDAGIPGELAPYTMVPAWSPSLYNGMVHPSYGRTQMYHPQHSNIGGDENNSGKRTLNCIEGKRELEDNSIAMKKQRLISPSSSNEKPDEEPPDSLPSDRKTPWNHHRPHPPIMYNIPTHWQQPPSYPPPPHMAYPHPPPPYPMYSPYPPPWAVYGPQHSPHIYPPHGVPFQRHQAPPDVSKAKDHGKSLCDKARLVSNESLRNDSEESDSASPSPSPNECLNRCIPLKHPIPKRSWSSSSIDRKLPDFSLLVNYPDHLSKGRNFVPFESNGPSTNDGTKNCVMCGQLRICSTGISSFGDGGGGRRPRTTLVPSPEDSTSSIGNERTTHIIPRQNKGVCTVCDVAVWVVRDHDNLEIKWCKGCKNFRPWAAFGDKGLATKCVRCRKRQKEKYATQKISGQNLYENNGEVENQHSTSAVNGLRKLMKSSPMK